MTDPTARPGWRNEVLTSVHDDAVLRTLSALTWVAWQAGHAHGATVTCPDCRHAGTVRAAPVMAPLFVEYSTVCFPHARELATAICDVHALQTKLAFQLGSFASLPLVGF